MKSSKEVLSGSVREQFESGEIQIVGTRSVLDKGFLMIPRLFANKQHFTPSAKLVFSTILWHAFNEKDSSFPGQQTIAKECGIKSIKTVYNALLQLTGLNEQNEAYLEVIHRGHGLTNLYRIYLRMDTDKLDNVVSKRKAKIGKNYRSRQMIYRKPELSTIEESIGKNYRSAVR